MNHPLPATSEYLPLAVSGSVLLCPMCRDQYTHLTAVHVSVRQPGWTSTETTVSTFSGEVSGSPTPDLVERAVPLRDRDRISLVGYCESCGQQFALVFEQHKGTTYTEAVDLRLKAHSHD